MALTAWWLLANPALRPLAYYSVASFVVIVAFGPITAAATASSSPIMGLLERVTIFTFTLYHRSPSGIHRANAAPQRNREECLVKFF